MSPTLLLFIKQVVLKSIRVIGRMLSGLWWSFCWCLCARGLRLVRCHVIKLIDTISGHSRWKALNVLHKCLIFILKELLHPLPRKWSIYRFYCTAGYTHHLFFYSWCGDLACQCSTYLSFLSACWLRYLCEGFSPMFWRYIASPSESFVLGDTWNYT